MNHKDWKLFRCIHNDMGQHVIEGEGDDNQFEKCLAEGCGEVGWLIGESVPYHGIGMVVVKVVLEGDKEVLEYVMELARKVDREELVEYLGKEVKTTIDQLYKKHCLAAGEGDDI